MSKSKVHYEVVRNVEQLCMTETDIVPVAYNSVVKVEQGALVLLSSSNPMSDVLKIYAPGEWYRATRVEVPESSELGSDLKAATTSE